MGNCAACFSGTDGDPSSAIPRKKSDHYTKLDESVSSEQTIGRNTSIDSSGSKKQQPRLMSQSSINRQEKISVLKGSKKFKNFNEIGDDYKKLTPKEIEKLMRYKKFEKMFPWY